MTDKKLSQLSGGGGGEVIDEISLGNQAAIGSSGSLFNIVPPSGKRVIITALASSNFEVAVVIDFGGRFTQTFTLRDGQTTQAGLIVGQSMPLPASGANGAGTLGQIKGGIGETLDISKVAATTSTTYLSYIITD